MRAYLLLAALLLPLAAQAEDVKVSTITVRGEALTKLAPDQATVPVTLVSDNKDLTSAKEANDEKLKKLLATAADYGVAKEDMQTEYNSVQPQYDYSQNVTTQTDVYTGNLNFNFDVTDLAQDKIDAFTEALEKADLTNIGSSHQRGVAKVVATYHEQNQDAKTLHDLTKKKESEVQALALAAGIDKNRINSNSYETKGKESRSESPKPRISGYKSTVNVNLVIKDKEKLTPLINAIVKDGVDTIGNVSFSLGNATEKKTKEETLLKALKDASDKAHKLADAAGMTLDRPLAIEEGNGEIQPPPFRPYPMGLGGSLKMMAAGNAAQQSAEMPEGLTEIRQSVTVTYALK